MTNNQTAINNPWEAAIGGGFVKFDKDDVKVVTVTDWKLDLVSKTFDPKEGPREVWELSAKVLDVNGESVEAKMSTASKPFLAKLKPILSVKSPSEKVKLQVVKTGDGKTTAYSVKELK